MATVAELQTMRTQSKDALVKVIQKDLLSDLEVINQYEAKAKASESEQKAAEWNSLRDEVLKHFSELTSLLYYLDPTTTDLFFEDQSEVAKTATRLGFEFCLLKG